MDVEAWLWSWRQEASGKIKWDWGLRKPGFSHVNHGTYEISDGHKVSSLYFHFLPQEEPGFLQKLSPEHPLLDMLMMVEESRTPFHLLYPYEGKGQSNILGISQQELENSYKLGEEDNAGAMPKYFKTSVL
ncbi:hypothetical protein HGM15179_007948 [Zosterops borbonicus]|uniref:Uncharacterized protein n=1 Tax=Zosterops borbonicus TaxID=364589 RepID=A0A8K1GHR3_9PASS|nr:hypothetical protein HGM15179_007948 [Zosterops borbonicus]